jgi:hypothetical protein
MVTLYNKSLEREGFISVRHSRFKKVKSEANLGQRKKSIVELLDEHLNLDSKKE